MELKPAILYVDGDQDGLQAFQRAFGFDYSLRTAHSGAEALEILEKEGDQFPLLIIDQESLKDGTGLEVCEKAGAARPNMLRIILTSKPDTTFLLEAINRAHIHHCLVKPWKQDELKPILVRAFHDYEKRVSHLHEMEMRANKDQSLEIEIREIYDSGTIVGDDSGLKKTMEVVRKVAPTDSTVLILGETGTGKELLARAIHEQSRRKNGPFIPVHCASLVETLMESELFGYEKGAFTGANEMHRGRFEMAKGGTLFLDEIGELTEEIQVKLLRFLQEKEIYRVGANRPITADVRLLSATHRNLEERVRKGKFREDLFYRLNVISIRVPPLRERKEDISRLALHFLKKSFKNTGKLFSFPSETLDYLSRYDWPGNIRELQNVIERATILCEGSTITPDDLNLNIEQTLRVEEVDLSQVTKASEMKLKIRDEEMQHLSELLVKAKGNITEAARLSGIPRTTLFHRLRKYHLI